VLRSHFSDQDKALGEMKRVLKPGGKIIILEIDPNTPKGKRLNFTDSISYWSKILPTITAK
jgi:ubiquinone/menaquinone biosynthesis C-methylase UbiE